MFALILVKIALLEETSGHQEYHMNIAEAGYTLNTLSSGTTMDYIQDLRFEANLISIPETRLEQRLR